MWGAISPTMRKKLHPSWPRRTSVTSGSFCQRGFALLLGLVGIVPLDASDVLVAGDHDEQFVAQRSRLRDEGAVAGVQVIKSAAAQYASFTHRRAGLSNTRLRDPWQKCGQSG